MQSTIRPSRYIIENCWIKYEIYLINMLLQIVLGEVRCLQKMRHPNIVSYHGAWIQNNHSYILMEYATRCTLKNLLEKREIPLKEEVINY